jgi:hypothetical protein
MHLIYRANWEETMRIKGLVVLVLSLALIAASASLVLAQGSAKEKMAPPAGQQGPIKVTLEGKIAFMKAQGEYQVITEAPHEEYLVMNTNAKLLGALAQQGKTVKIEGNLPRGAYLLFIEKIDGQAYQGDK